MNKARTIFSLLVVVSLVLSVVAVVGCGKTENDNTTPADTTSPSIVSAQPADGATGVDLEANLRATFSEEMDASTVNGTTFILSGPEGAVAGTVTCSSSLATFEPSTQLEGAASYTATISAAVQDLAGNGMESDFSWSFTTAADKTKPEIHGIIAKDLHATTVNITWTTNEPATSDVLYRTLSTYELKTVSGSGAQFATSHTVALSGLLGSTEYRYTVRSVDRAGNITLADEKSFTTAMPTPANFVVTDLTFSSPQAYIFEEVTASVQVQNTGEADGDFNAVLKVDGVQLDPQKVHIAGLSTQRVSVPFSVDKDATSVVVEMGGLTATLPIKSTWDGEPVRHVGDSWTSNMRWQGFMYSGVATITGEEKVQDKECWVLSLTLDNDFKYTVPVFGGVLTVNKDSTIGKFHEGTGLPIEIHGTGEYVNALLGIHFKGKVVATLSYRFSGGVPYPLVTDKEVKAVVTFSAKIYDANDHLLYTLPPTSMDGKFKVVGEESCLVQGKTLMSTKVIVLEGNDQLLATVWVLDSIGWFYKVVIEPDKDYIELQDSSRL